MKAQLLLAVIAIAAINASSVYEIVAFENAAIQEVFAKGTRGQATLTFSAGDMQSVGLKGICNTCNLRGMGSSMCTKMMCSNMSVERYVIAAVENYLRANTKGGASYNLESIVAVDGQKIFVEARD